MLRGALGNCLVEKAKLTGVSFLGGSFGALGESTLAEYKAASPWGGLCFSMNSVEV